MFLWLSNKIRQAMHAEEEKIHDRVGRNYLRCSEVQLWKTMQLLCLTPNLYGQPLAMEKVITYKYLGLMLPSDLSQLSTTYMH